MKMIKFGLGLGDLFSAGIIRLVGKLLGTEKSHKPLRSHVLSRYLFLWLTLDMYTRDTNMMNGVLKSSNIQKQIILGCSPPSCFGRINLGIPGKDDVQFLHQFDSA